MAFISNLGKPIIDNVALAVVHGCSDKGMIMYPNMLLISKSPKDIWTLPVIQLQSLMGDIDPFDAITCGMFEEYGIRIAMIKWIHSEKAIITKEDKQRWIQMEYFDVRVAGQVKRKSRRYKESMYRSYDAMDVITHKSVGLSRWVAEMKRRKKDKEVSKTANISNFLKSITSTDNMTGAAIIKNENEVMALTPVNDYMKMFSPANPHIDYAKLCHAATRQSKSDVGPPMSQIDDWKGLL